MTQRDAVSIDDGGQLLARIQAALERLGKWPASVTTDDLSAVDEFHIGGRQACDGLIPQLGLSPTSHVLDVGCGLGGTARLMASRYRCRVSGVERSREYVATAAGLSAWTGFRGQVDFCQGDALRLPYGDGVFDVATMLHVGMGIENKTALWCEVHRVLRPGARFGIYDVMQTAAGSLDYPMPWAASAATSHLCSPEVYRQTLQDCGFSVIAERDRRQFALEFFGDVRRQLAAAGAPVLGVHLLLGSSTAARMQNIVSGVSAGLVAPVELIVRKGCGRD